MTSTLLALFLGSLLAFPGTPTKFVMVGSTQLPVYIYPLASEPSSFEITADRQETLNELLGQFTKSLANLKKDHPAELELFTQLPRFPKDDAPGWDRKIAAIEVVSDSGDLPSIELGESRSGVFFRYLHKGDPTTMKEPAVLVVTGSFDPDRFYDYVLEAVDLNTLEVWHVKQQAAIRKKPSVRQGSGGSSGSGGRD